MIFQDRTEAGKKLAVSLEGYRDTDAVVYALPRGGVAVGIEVATHLNVPLDLIIARKIGHPLSPEYAIGAVTETGEPIWNEAELSSTTKQWRESQIQQARGEAKRRRLSYLGSQPNIPAKDKTAIVVDDGIATGLTMIAAIADLRKRRPKEVVVAVPVAPKDTVEKLKNLTERTVVLHIPDGTFWAIGNYYLNFGQVEDEEVKGLTERFTGLANKNGELEK